MLRFIKNVVERVRNRGFRSSAIYAVYRLCDAFVLWRLGIAAAMHQTMINVSSDQLGFRQADFNSHDPSESYYAFRSIMRRFVRPREDDVFLDYGSGMGRVLLMAATFPFHRVIGVEYSQELSANSTRIIAQVTKRLRCQAIQVVTADASDYDLPADVTVIYFYNPFGGDVLEKTIRRIKASVDLSPRKIQIVYYDPSKFEKFVHDCDWLSKKAEVLFPAVDKCRIAIYENRM